MKELHKFQELILSKFIRNRELSYLGMKPTKVMENNKFQFHLDQLKRNDLVEKVGTKYRLTNKGKQHVARMDEKVARIKAQAKIGVAVCCTRKGNNGREFLVFTRLKQPFFGCQGLMAGKMEYGETVIDTAKRELKEETQLEGEPKAVGINHYCTVHKGEVVDDLLQFLCWVDEPKGSLKGCKEGKYEWVAEKNLKTFIKKPFQSVEQFLKEIEMVNSFNGDLKINELKWEDKEGKSF